MNQVFLQEWVQSSRLEASRSRRPIPVKIRDANLSDTFHVQILLAEKEAKNKQQWKTTHKINKGMLKLKTANLIGNWFPGVQTQPTKFYYETGGADEYLDFGRVLSKISTLICVELSGA